MIAAFQWLCNFFLKKKRGKKKYLKKRKIKTYSVWSLFFFFEEFDKPDRGRSFRGQPRGRSRGRGRGRGRSSSHHRSDPHPRSHLAGDDDDDIDMDEGSQRSHSRL